MEITCDKSTPTEEGVYIWYPSLTLLPEMIRVIQYPSKEEFGVKWPAYLGVPTYNGAHVGKLQGKFSERLTFSMKYAKENMKYIAKFPYTDAMGTVDSVIVSDEPMESKEEEALWYFNRSREHDGLRPITVLPFHTTFTAIEEI